MDLCQQERASKKQKMPVEEVDKDDAKRKNQAEEDDGDTAGYLWKCARDTAADHFAKSLVLLPLEELRQRVSLDYIRKDGAISTEAYNDVSQGVWGMLHEIVKFVKNELSKWRGSEKGSPDDAATQEADMLLRMTWCSYLARHATTRHWTDDIACFEKIFTALSNKYALQTYPR